MKSLVFGVNVNRILFLLVFFTGCSVGTIRNHNPHFKTTRIAKTYEGRIFPKNINHIYEVKFSKKGLTSAEEYRLKKKREILDRSYLKCRGTTFEMPNGVSVRKYLAMAITDELDAAQILDKAGEELNVVIHKLESDTSGIEKASWNLDFEYKLGKKNFRVVTKFEYESAFAGGVACQNTSNTLTDALSMNFQSFFIKLVERK